MQTTTRKRKVRTTVISIALVAFLTIAGAVAGYVAGQVRSPQYTSVANLIWDPSALRYSDSSAYVPDSVSLALQVEGQTERVLSDAVVVPASEELGMTVRDLRKVVTASVGNGSTLIVIEAEAGSPERAQEIATSVVTAYTTSVETSLAAQYTSQSEALDPSIERVTDELDDAEPESAIESSLASQLASLTAQQEQLNAKAAAVATPLSSLQEPSLPDEPSTPSALTLAVVGGGLGFLLAVAIIVLFALRRRAPVRTVVVEQPRTVEQPRAESTYPVVPPRPIVRENLAE